MEIEGTTESSDSDEDLEDTHVMFRRNHLEQKDNSEKTSQEPSMRLDNLLEEHRRDGGKHERLKALRDKLLAELANSPGLAYKNQNEDLGSEHASHIELLKVKSITLRNVHPGLTVFTADRFCCLFTEDIDPVTYFIQPDRMWSSISVGVIPAIASSHTLIDHVIASPNFDGIMQWLMHILSIHQSSVTAKHNETAMVAIMSRLQLIRSQRKHWKLTANGVLRLLINLGADPQELQFQKTCHQSEVIREQVAECEMKSVKTTNEAVVNSQRLESVLDVLTLALHGRSVVAKEELSHIFYMLSKAALDTSLSPFLSRNFHLCLAAIIDHYSDSDWLLVVPKLCQELGKVSDHHHNQVYLASLLPDGARGKYLQMRLSYTCLFNHLMAGERQLEYSKLTSLQITDVTDLGKSAVKGQPSTLAVKLHSVLKEDRYKAFSLLRLLNMSVGDIFDMATNQKKQLEYLISQVNLLQRTFKDNVAELDLTKVKDTMKDMTVKWSLALQQQRMNEGSVFPWATATTHQWVQPEILRDREDKGEVVSTDINQQSGGFL